MVVCKYFLEGRCAFGDDCRYEHTVGERGGSSQNYFPGGYRQPAGGYRPRSQGPQGYERAPYRPNDQQFRGSFTPQYRPPVPRFTTPFNPPSGVMQIGTISDADILENVKRDIEEMWSQNPSGVFQPGKIWPFSSYSFSTSDGYIKTDPLFNLNDVSVEELRCAAYEARHDPARWAQFVTSVVNEGNKVRLICTNVSNGTIANPLSEAARSIVAEVRSKSDQRAARQQSEPGFSVLPPAYPSTSSISAMSEPVPNFSNPNQQIGISQPTTNGIYSDTNMLTAEDFEQFAAPEFIQGKVPYKPPPRNLC